MNVSLNKRWKSKSDWPDSQCVTLHVMWERNQTMTLWITINIQYTYYVLKCSASQELLLHHTAVMPKIGFILPLSNYMTTPHHPPPSTTPSPPAFWLLLFTLLLCYSSLWKHLALRKWWSSNNRAMAASTFARVYCWVLKSSILKSLSPFH